MEYPLLQHGETHKVGGADPLDSEALANAINLADLAEKLHDSLTGVTANQHHTATVAGDINLNDLAEKNHASLASVTADQHHVAFVSADAAALITTHTADDNAHHPLGIMFNLGVAATGTKLAQVLIPGTLTISLVKIYADVAPTGASLIVDVNKDGTTIFTTQGNRPEIAIDGHADDSGTPEITALAAGDRLSVDVDQVGSTIAGGNDLLVVVIFV